MPIMEAEQWDRQWDEHMAAVCYVKVTNPKIKLKLLGGDGNTFRVRRANLNHFLRALISETEHKGEDLQLDVIDNITARELRLAAFDAMQVCPICTLPIERTERVSTCQAGCFLRIDDDLHFSRPEGDIYAMIAEKNGITRDEAKTRFMWRLYGGAG